MVLGAGAATVEPQTEETKMINRDRVVSILEQNRGLGAAADASLTIRQLRDRALLVPRIDREDRDHVEQSDG